MIGKNIQIFRKQMNMTQETLAERVNVARQTIVKWESGESSPDLETAGRLAEVLQVSVDDLVNTEEGEIESDRQMKGKHIFGLVTIGDKGQIVIPVRARKVFGIRPGDQLMVLGDEDQGLALVDGKLFMEIAEEIRNGRQ